MSMFHHIQGVSHEEPALLLRKAGVDSFQVIGISILYFLDICAQELFKA